MPFDVREQPFSPVCFPSNNPEENTLVIYNSKLRNRSQPSLEQQLFALQDKVKKHECIIAYLLNQLNKQEPRLYTKKTKDRADNDISNVFVARQSSYVNNPPLRSNLPLNLGSYCIDNYSPKQHSRASQAQDKKPTENQPLNSKDFSSDEMKTSLASSFIHSLPLLEEEDLEELKSSLITNCEDAQLELEIIIADLSSEESKNKNDNPLNTAFLENNDALKELTSFVEVKLETENPPAQTYNLSSSYSSISDTCKEEVKRILTACHFYDELQSQPDLIEALHYAQRKYELADRQTTDPIDRTYCWPITTNPLMLELKASQYHLRRMITKVINLLICCEMTKKKYSNVLGESFFLIQESALPEDELILRMGKILQLARSFIYLTKLKEESHKSEEELEEQLRAQAAKDEELKIKQAAKKEKLEEYQNHLHQAILQIEEKLCRLGKFSPYLLERLDKIGEKRLSEIRKVPNLYFLEQRFSIIYSNNKYYTEEVQNLFCKEPYIKVLQMFEKRRQKENLKKIEFYDQCNLTQPASNEKLSESTWTTV